MPKSNYDLPPQLALLLGSGLRRGPTVHPHTRLLGGSHQPREPSPGRPQELSLASLPLLLSPLFHAPLTLQSDFFFQNANLDMSFPDEQPVLASPKADLSVWPPRPCAAQLLWSHPPPHSPVLTLPHHTVVCFHFCNIALSLPATPGPLHTLFPLLGGLLSLSLF